MVAVAEQFLSENINELQRKKDGLSVWRIKNTNIISALTKFATGSEWDEKDEERTDQLAEVLDLFNELNSAMWEQEKTNNLWIGLPTDLTPPGKGEVIIVFGGKVPKPRADSISEKLIELLLKSATKIYTVSRTALPPQSNNVSHTLAKNLDGVGGKNEFEGVMNKAIDEEWNKHPEKSLTIYFTLGRHNGVNPFASNVMAAQNFADALLNIKSGPLKGDSEMAKSFRVVLTGTDATKANTSPDYNVEVEGNEITVFSYKTWKYNFVYSMSKLCQFYIIADAIQEITKIIVPVDLKSTIKKMKAFIEKAGDDGVYKGDSDSEITMSELGAISIDWDKVEDALKQHLKVARGISICYTPLHATPWIDNSFKKKDDALGSPKAFIIQQITSRLKNAISIELAARAHF